MKILMVCLGNICRSPLAQGILEKKIKELDLDWSVGSAGTASYHIGHPPDERSVAKAMQYGIDISHQKARQITSVDLDRYDLILTMDSQNYNRVQRLVTNQSHPDKIKLIMNYVYPEQNMAVPDPYYDGTFQNVYDLLDAAIEELIKNVTK